MKVCANVTDVFNHGVTGHQADMLTTRTWKACNPDGRCRKAMKDLHIDVRYTNVSDVKIIQSLNCMKVLRGPIERTIPGQNPGFCMNPRNVKRCECRKKQ